jgi:hypothetical protein
MFGATPARGLPLPRIRRLTWWEGREGWWRRSCSGPTRRSIPFALASARGFIIRPIRIIAGVLIALAGAVWLLQGLNVSFAPRSFMSADPLWAVIGSVTLLAGIVLAATGLRRA